MLSKDRIDVLLEKHAGDTDGFLAAYTAEVRKQDTELIRKMLDALSWLVCGVSSTGGRSMDAKEAITAARARLGESP